MLKSWRVERFKPIIDSGTIELAGLTVLSGENSSGKSSLLQSILVIAQTLANPVSYRPLILNSRFLQLGTFKDVLNNSKSKKKSIVIEFELEGIRQTSRDTQYLESIYYNSSQEMSGNVKIKVEFTGATNAAGKSAITDSTQLDVESVSIEFTSDEVVPHPVTNQKIRLSGNDIILNTKRISNKKEETEVYANLIEDWLFPHVATLGNVEYKYLTILNHFLPEDLLITYNIYERIVETLKELVSELCEWVLRSTQADNILSNIESRMNWRNLILKNIGVKNINLEAELSTEFQKFVQERCINYEIPKPQQISTPLDLLTWLAHFNQDIEKRKKLLVDDEFQINFRDELLGNLEEIKTSKKVQDAFTTQEAAESITGNPPLVQLNTLISRYFTTKIRYLGPLRANPQVVQGFSPSSEFDDVGINGEYAAAVYDANQYTFINFFDPYEKTVKEDSLEEALNIWLRYLNVGEKVQTEEAGRTGVVWNIVSKKSKKSLPLSAVGVGVSQVLPILVMGLLSPEETFLIIEQPELHLHPRVQSKLGEFFIGLTKCNKQCLVETHSENLINQLRLHIVKSGGLEKSNCNIYFARQDENNMTQFEKVIISEGGAIENWPDGFFDETIRQESEITEQSIMSLLEN